jgi:hypothetical protein
MSETFVPIETHLEELKDLVLYEVVAHCTGCNEGAMVMMTDDFTEAQDIARQGERITRDDEGTIHNYETAIVEVKRKSVWVTKQVSDISDISGEVND